MHRLVGSRIEYLQSPVQRAGDQSASLRAQGEAGGGFSVVTETAEEATARHQVPHAHLGTACRWGQMTGQVIEFRNEYIGMLTSSIYNMVGYRQVRFRKMEYHRHAG